MFQDAPSPFGNRSPSSSDADDDDLPHAVFCFCGEECAPDDGFDNDDDGDVRIYCSTACARKDALLALSRTYHPSPAVSASSSTASLACHPPPLQPLALSTAHNQPFPPQQRPPLPHAASSTSSLASAASSSSSSAAAAAAVEAPPHSTHYRRMQAEAAALHAHKAAAREARRAARERERQQQAVLDRPPGVALGRCASNRSGRERIQAQRAVARLEQAKHRRNQASVASAAPSVLAPSTAGSRLTRSSGFSSLFGLGADLSRSNTAASSASSASAASSSVISTHPSRSSAYKTLPELIASQQQQHRRDESASSIASSSLASFQGHSASSSLSGWGFRQHAPSGSLGQLAAGIEEMDALAALAEAPEDDNDVLVPHAEEEEEEEQVEQIRIVSPLRRRPLADKGKAARAAGLASAFPSFSSAAAGAQDGAKGWGMSDVLDQILEMERGFVVGAGLATSPAPPSSPPHLAPPGAGASSTTKAARWPPASPPRALGLLPPVDLASPPQRPSAADDRMDISTPPRPAFAAGASGVARASLTPRAARILKHGQPQPVLSLGQLREPASAGGGQRQQQQQHQRKRSLADCSPPPSPAAAAGKRRSSSFSASSYASAAGRPSAFFAHTRTRSSPQAAALGFASRLSPTALLEQQAHEGRSHRQHQEGEADAPVPKRRKQQQQQPLPLEALTGSPCAVAARPRTLVYAAAAAAAAATSPSAASVRSAESVYSVRSSAGGDFASPLAGARALPGPPAGSSPRATSFRGSTSSQGTFTFPRAGSPSTPTASLLAEPPIFPPHPISSAAAAAGNPAARFPTMDADGVLSAPAAPPAETGLGGALSPASPSRLWAAFGGGGGGGQASPAGTPRKWGWKW